MIYATSASETAGVAGEKTINVNAEGFYYFDGTVWKKISASNGADTSIYTDDGTLTANRTVEMDGKNLTFSGNGNVGIGTAAPSSKIHIVSSESYGAFQMQDGSQSQGKFLASDNNGRATWVNSPLTPVVFGDLDPSTVLFTLSPNQYTGDKITLTRGKWLVYVGKLLNPDSNPSSSNNTWVRLTLSSSQTSQQTTGFSFLSSSLVSGWLENVNHSNNRFTFLSGVIAVNVTSSSLTLFLRTREFNTIGNAPVVRTRGDYGENYLFATPTY